METVHCVFILIPTSEQLMSDAELTLREFSADTSCKALHAHPLEGIFPGSWCSAGFFHWSLAPLPDFNSAGDFLIYLLSSSEPHPQWLCLIVASSKQGSKRMRAGTHNAETPISARGKLCFLKLSKWKN